MDFAGFFESAVSGISAKLKERVTGRRLLAYNTALLGRRIFSGEEPVVWANVAVPFEIVNCFPVASTYSEFVGAVLAGASAAKPFLERAEGDGFPTDGCSYHRALLGAFAEGVIPRPIAVVSTTCPCDGGLKAVAEIGRMSAVPAMFVTVPQRSDPEAVKYLADQLEDMALFLAEVTKKPFDRDLLRLNIEKSNAAAEALKKVYSFAGTVPAPYSHRELNNFQIVMIPFMNADSGLEIARTYAAEFADLASQGYCGIGRERLRLLWIQNRIQFPNDLLDHLAENFGANIVWDELNEIHWDPIDPEDPFTGLAIRLIQSPLGPDLSRRLDTLKRRAAEYSIDGAVHPCHWGCRQSQNARRLMAEALEQVNVPMITLDVDCIDSRSYAQGQLLTRLEAFCEML